MSSAASSSSSSTTAAPVQQRAENRLPASVRAVNYSVELTPDLVARTFKGSVDVTLKLNEPRKTILLNSIEIEIQSCSAKFTNGTANATDISLNVPDEIATFTFDKELPVGEVVLTIQYTGILNADMRGFYASSYKDQAGVEHTIATTQFEATDARRAIPCIDEPAQKATWTVTLVAPTHLTALSNQPIASSTKVSETHTRHTFQPTPIVSSYLIAFVVGAFDKIETTTPEGTLIRCFATPGKAEQCRFALDVAVKLLPYYNQWFEEPYPLPKLDMIAVPDFAAGAMENWGLITYREAALLLDPANSSSQTKQWVAVCVAHEIAHQWFGNLVTMEWWTHLWLNEGFATWMENYAVDYLYPEWRMWDQFVYSDLNSSFDLDSLENSHPIEVDIYHASETDEIFDTISYCKGCVAIRMLQEYLGPDDFRRGLVKYIKKYAYGNALTQDLWNTLSEVSGKDVTKVMTAWTKETGFPLITLEDNSSSDANIMQFKVSQQRFLQTGPDAKCASIWPAPINFVCGSAKKPVSAQMFDTRTGTITLDLKAAGVPAGQQPKWFKLNGSQAAMYRVRYTPKQFSALCEAVKNRDPLLTPADRLGVQNDAFALTRCGLLSTVQLLELVQSYQGEDDYTVWADLASNLADLSGLIQSEPATFALFSSFVNRLLSTILAKVGWEKKAGEEHTTSLLRAKIIGFSLRYSHPDSVRTALSKFAAFYASGQLTGGASTSSDSLVPDLRGAVYAAVVRNGGVAEYEQIKQLGERVTLSEEQVRLLNSLGHTQDESLIRRTLDAAISPAVRTQDGPSLIQTIANNPRGSDLCWEYCKSHWTEILAKYQQSSSLSRIVSQVGNFTSREKKAEVESFFKANAHPGADRAIAQGIERIESNALWLERDGAAIRQWLQANVQA